MLCNLVEELTRQGIENVVVSTTSSLHEFSLRPRLEACATFVDLDSSTLLSSSAARALRDVFQRERPDIIQTWMHTAGVAAGVVAKSLGMDNLVWGIHSKELLQFPGHPARRTCFGRFLGLNAALLPRKIISCSRIGMDLHHRRYGYPLKKMIWIGNGIDTTRFQPDTGHRENWRKNLGIPASAPVIGMATRLAPVKDVATFLRAATELQPVRPDVHFVLCGDVLAHADPETKRIAARLPAPERFHWLGFQERMETVFPLFDVLTVTSLSEAYPMVLIEAMACGVPCVSTDVGDAAPILGNLGTIVPVRSPTAIVAAWQVLLDVPDEAARERSARVRRHAVDHFSLETCTTRYRTLYEDILSN